MKIALESSCLVKKPPSSTLHSFKFRPLVIIKATTDSSSSSSSQSQEPTKPEVKTNVGFGSSSSSVQTKEGNKGKRSKERRSVIRRTPLEKPAFLSKETETKTPEQSSSAETAFLLTWLGLGSLIIIEGLVLAASGLFPEEWDKYFVKYLYPSFTPTVFLFVAGTVVYGVSKYLQGENMRS